jgi:hypothetical protein
MVLIHIPSSLYLTSHCASISFLETIATASSFLPFAMASSSSNSFNSSAASESSEEMTLEFDSEAAHEACTPLHWDTEEWNFRT